MMADHSLHEGNAVLHRHIRQANKTSVGTVVAVNQLAEVFVHRDEHPVFGVCPLEDRSIARVNAQLSRIQNIVEGEAQPLRKALPYTIVREELHDAFTETSAKVLPLITAWA